MQKEQERKIQIINAVLKRMALKTNSDWGHLAEKFAKVNYRKVRIPSLTGTAKYRVPDILSETALIEIKNVKYQRLTNQIKDYIAFCHESNRHLILYLKDDVKLSSKLRGLIEKGHIEIRPLGIIFTEKGQKVFFEAIKPMALKALAQE